MRDRQKHVIARCNLGNIETSSRHQIHVQNPLTSFKILSSNLPKSTASTKNIRDHVS